MTELALHILDIANNSIRAGAKNIRVSVTADTEADRLKISVADDGCGMDEEFLKRVSDPFATTRTTRRVGMGIPLFKMAALMTEGSFDIKSAPGSGTVTEATFKLGHIDRQPLGDLASTFVTLLGGAPDTDFILDYTVDGRNYLFSTAQVKQALECETLSEPYIIEYLSEMIKENIEKVNEGVVI